ncbi:hypothetical protein EES45_34575 [Streptomyces sp. ADI97-07]|uniref:hypothetical protein n=1 Tax=Streptomyces sp. ADI97-07 TaxID=1522762 RepID=UPI000F9873CC|nr:hypothetical protein [Streptomyces sp. ADI97-07]RPK71529.1 hypothetical protein EES45_34575 [Streptomyces sp. ADI97-07]
MTLVADTSTDGLRRLSAGLRWVAPPALTPEVIEQIVDDVESVLGLGSPVPGFSSWSAKDRPHTRAQQPLALRVADLRLRLDFLILEAASWDPDAAAEEIARAEGLADRDLPADVDEARGLLNLMALAVMDLLERIAPVPPDCRVLSSPAPVGAAEHGSPDHRRGTPDVQPHDPVPSRHGLRRRGRHGRR